MARIIDYFFTLQSPWSALGHTECMRIAATYGATVAFKPIRLGAVFAATGGLPLAKRHPARQRYRSLELQRWIAKRGVAMRLHPKHWPFDPALADQSIIGAIATGGDGARVVARAFAGVFQAERDLGDERVVAAVLDEAGLDGSAIIAATKSGAYADAYDTNTALALERGVIGAPSYGLDGEIFWGQDRLPLLDDALRSGRPAYTPDM